MNATMTKNRADFTTAINTNLFAVFHAHLRNLQTSTYKEKDTAILTGRLKQCEKKWMTI